MAYEGEILNACGVLLLDFSSAQVVAVSGSGPNVCGHLLLYVSSNGGYYLHVAGSVHGYPRYMNAEGYGRYLRENGKTEIRRVSVSIPNSQGAYLYLERLMSDKWTWLVLPNNCVAFCEEIIAAGGGTWSSGSNCPAVATTPTLANQIQSFLNGLENEIYRQAGVPRF